MWKCGKCDLKGPRRGKCGKVWRCGSVASVKCGSGEKGKVWEESVEEKCGKYNVLACHECFSCSFW